MDRARLEHATHSNRVMHIIGRFLGVFLADSEGVTAKVWMTWVSLGVTQLSGTSVLYCTFLDYLTVTSQQHPQQAGDDSIMTTDLLPYNCAQ